MQQDRQAVAVEHQPWQQRHQHPAREGDGRALLSLSNILKDWSKTTHGPFRIRMFDGKHIHVLNRTAYVLAAVCEILSDHLSGE
jgi:hypothetical protein